MGMYLNKGAEGYRQALNSEIYVDKSNLIVYMNKLINTQNKYICFSRPRRFGKTMAAKMLMAYYDHTVDASKVFAGLKISKNIDFTKYANKYNVIFLDIAKLWTEGDDSVEGMIAFIKRALLYDLLEEYTDVKYFDKTRLSICMENVYRQTGRQFIILIDEWDLIFREQQNDEISQKKYLDFLRAWLKDQEYIALAYMTGILPIKKYGKHSALNMFQQYSMDDPQELEEFVGFTGEEVRALCDEYGVDYSQCKAWYDGYSFRKIKEVYNPLSVVLAVPRNVFKNYWNKTETYEALQMFIQINYDGLKDVIIKLMNGERYCIDTTTYSNDMTTFNNADDILTLLIHLGYLGYDSEEKEVFIPNNEIRSEFASAVKDSKQFTEVAKAIKNSDMLLKATLAKDAATVAELVGIAHTEMSHLQYNDENALSYAISLAYYTARNKYTVIRELPTGKGFADIVFIPRKYCKDLPALVVELKWNHSAKTAIKQIKQKNYMDALKEYVGNILLVGINYSKKTKKHTCKIEIA